MKKQAFMVLIIVMIVTILGACGKDENAKSDSDEVKDLNVKFDYPDTVKVGETIHFKATVTYGGEKEPDADEVAFEYWEKGDKDNSTKVKADNNDDGTYTAEVKIDKAGDYEMYSHVTADGLHTMPKKKMTVEE